MDLQGKIEILREMINGNVPPEEYPLEFQGRSLAALNAELVEYEKAAEEFGPHGHASKEERGRKAEEAIHMAGHMQIEMAHAMEHHNDFIENGMFGRERLDTFSNMLDNDDYWQFLQENEEERNKVREQHFNGMIKAIEEEERSVLDMSEREVDLQGEENMHLLIDKEVEVQTKGLPPEEKAEAEKSLRDKFEEHTGIQTSGNSLEEQGEAVEAFQAGVSSSAAEADETLAAAVTEEAKNVKDIDDMSDFWNSIDVPDDKEKIQSLVKQNPETAKAFAAGVQKAEQKSQSTDLETANKVLAEKAQGGVEETGKSEPDGALAQSAKPPAEPSLSAS